MQWSDFTWLYLLIPAVPFLIWYHLRSLSDFPVWQKRVSLALRIVVLGLLAAALAGPVLMRETDRQMVVFAIDRSESIDQAARDQTNTFLAQAIQAAEQADVDVRFLEFDREPRSLRDEWTVGSEPTEGPEEHDSVAESDDAADDATATTDAAANTDDSHAEATSPGQDADAQPTDEQQTDAQQNDGADPDPARRGTDLEAAVRTAIASMPPSRVRRVVLLSDGNATGGGDVIAAAAEGGVPIWTVPLPSRSDPEVQLTRVDAPTQVRQGQPFFVEVIVSSNRDTEGYIDLYRGDIQIGDEEPKPVKIKKGENTFRFRQTVLGKRQESFAARLRGFDDTLLDNNAAETVVYAQGRPRVLLVDPDLDQTDSLRWALDEQSIDVEVRPPEGIPSDLTEIQGYECLVLSNVPATAMSMRQMDLIRIYVKELGGGLVMLGGDQSFGLGGYYRTQVEEILPVRSNFEKEREKPSLAMMLVIDKSGSMGGQKIELAKDAARAAVELLGPRDAIGVIAFDGSAYTVSELRSTSDKGQIIDAISTIEASGGTNMYPGMIDALDALRGATAKLKHVILMTDGVSSPGDFQGAASDMSANRITLSTVALGQGASEDLLEELAQIGGGRYYFCDSPDAVPQVFAKETVEASKSAINELPFTAQLVRPTAVLEGIDLELSPLLLGYVVTRPKPTAEFILASEAGDPLLAWWRYGLGMSVAFTSDAKNRWAGEWLAWPDFGPFWAQIIRHAMRKDDNRGVFVDVRREGETTFVSLDSVDQNGAFIENATTELTMIDPGLARQKLAMRQTAPGRFEAEIKTDRRGAYHLDLAQTRQSGSTQRSSRGISVGYSDELRLLPTATSTLERIATVSGGRFDPTPESIAERIDATAREPMPLWPWLLMIAMSIFVADVALRRIELSR
ncbi:von Willebrand factor type A domain protein [Stieleria neptunia]|uniref:von Willebrand factor type A domain protein n=1 Tax=Stieleria neptunia TaxID=2527979 RepID=A0A518HQE2_9BACT|nr:VWA domain-containing protein [Stieleria neptunia]QDV43027.1 von Willebrand factor type A domain protein [Stieleria neptunia]